MTSLNNNGENRRTNPFNPFETSMSVILDDERQEIPERRNLIRPTNQEEQLNNLCSDYSYSLLFCIRILKNEDSSIQKFVNYYLMTEIIYSILMLILTFLSLFDKLERRNFIPGFIFYLIPIVFSIIAYSSFNGAEDHYIRKFQKLDLAGLITLLFNIIKAFIFFGGLIFVLLLWLGNSLAEREFENEASKWGGDSKYKKPKFEISIIIFCLVLFLFSMGQIQMYKKLRDFRLVYLLRMDRIRNN